MADAKTEKQKVKEITDKLEENIRGQSCGGREVPPLRHFIKRIGG
jgi:hypothetical protein